MELTYFDALNVLDGESDEPMTVPNTVFYYRFWCPDIDEGFVT
jgi:hypothetical protein